MDAVSFALPTRATTAAFKLPKLNKGRLSPSNVFEILHATSFFNQTYGRTFNTHLTLSYEPLGLSDHTDCAALLSAFNHEAAKWVKRKAQAYGVDESYAYVYVHENVREHGFHTHLLTYIPRALAPSFKDWASKAIARLAKVTPLPPEALVIRIRHDQLRAHQADRQARWLRYILKSAPAVPCRAGDELVSLNELLEVARDQAGGEVCCAQRCGVSFNLGKKARANWDWAVPERVGDYFSCWPLDLNADRRRDQMVQEQIARMNI